jgi:hypothetical protein
MLTRSLSKSYNSYPDFAASKCSTSLKPEEILLLIMFIIIELKILFIVNLLISLAIFQCKYLFIIFTRTIRFSRAIPVKENNNITFLIK